ncbi:MAG: peptide ABC transporter substrate-binding protein [Clostridia bacterium]|nr:peptide ABC transporter substrate-binding protein [Clostridia bacterium]
MKKLIMLALCLALAASCFSFGSAEEEVVYRSLYSGEIGTLNYLTTATTNEFTVSANVIDTLIEHDKYGQLVPCLAESWELSEDGLTWTFHLRKDATWVTASGEYYANVTAEDFVTAAKYILNGANASSTAWILTDYILGAEEYFDSTTPPDEGEAAPEPFGFENVGVKATDEYTVAYTTSEPCPFFLSMLDYVCYMPLNAKFLEEKGDQFGLATSNENILYCGPYILSEFKPQEIRVYSKNASYWDAEHVYIDKIQQTYNKEATTLSPEMYLRGEIDDADISAAIAAEWLADEVKSQYIHPVRQVGQYSYFWCFNFDANFDAEYEPENWLLAANNENFRLSLFYALDRVKAKTVIEPENPEDLLWDTIMPQDISVYNGTDYTDMGALAEIEVGFDEEKAIAYRDAAIPELTEAGATLPIKVLTCYNPSSTGWAEECQVVEQQMEALLGTDYIDIIIQAGPSSGFLKEIRRSGKYAFMKCNWGLDFDDPVNLTDPFKETNNYNFMIKATDPKLYDEDGTMTYYKLLAAAKAMPGNDTEARYLAFAEAEAYLIDHAIVIPYGSDTGGYTASRLNPFEGQFGATGLATCRYKGQHLLDKPMSTDDYYEAYFTWLEERDALAN